MFTITGAIAGATITAVIAPQYLYFFFAAFLLTSFIGLRRLTEASVTEAVNQDRLSRWLKLRSSYFDEARKRVIEYRATNALWGGWAWS